MAMKIKNTSNIRKFMNILMLKPRPPKQLSTIIQLYMSIENITFKLALLKEEKARLQNEINYKKLKRDNIVSMREEVTTHLMENYQCLIRDKGELESLYNNLQETRYRNDWTQERMKSRRRYIANQHPDVECSIEEPTHEPDCWRSCF